MPVRSAIGYSAMRAVVVVLLQIPADVFSGLRQAAIFRSPDFLFLQAAMEPLDVAVAFRMVVSRPPMGDAQLRERFHEPRRSELCPVVGGQNEITFSASCWQTIQHCLFYRGVGTHSYFRRVRYTRGTLDAMTREALRIQ